MIVFALNIQTFIVRADNPGSKQLIIEIYLLCTLLVFCYLLSDKISV